MKRARLIIFGLVLLSMLTSCSNGKLQIKDSIVAPENRQPPLSGKWIIEDSIDSPYIKGVSDEEESLIGREVLFHDSAVVVDKDFILEPSFIYKNVNISDYLLYKYKISSEYLNLTEEEGEVISISSNNQFFYEFIKYSEDELFFFNEDKFYFLRKVVDEVSKEEIERYISVEHSLMRISNIEEVDTLRSGVLLGIKSYDYDEINDEDNWTYKTIWIRTNNRNISSIYEMDSLLVPRKKGFWTIDVKRNKNDNSIIDEIKAIEKRKYPEEYFDDVKLFTFEYGIEMDLASIEPSIIKTILYIGNDYICVEETNLANNRKALKTYPIDYLDNGKAIKISDVLGDEGLKTFVEGAQSIMKSDSSMFLDEESFGLFRRNGYWIMKGRINYHVDGEELYKDFNIKTIPPKELVNYDELVIPWNKIKSKIPEAIDAFTSPNEDIIIVVTRNNLQIYAIENNEISSKELGRVRLNSSDSIIMAEWSLGRYTTLWEEVIRSQGIKIK
ncbi:MAG: hypothetical protein GX021_00260 [Tissierellia bacterium]|nr:hypothetical protein [Tissierellia bacterium]